MTMQLKPKDRPSILIVDDVAANRFALKKLLNRMDAKLIEAESGEETLSIAIRTDHLALILLDVQMPVMDGYETAELLREEEQTKHIPIIFITAVHRDEDHILKGYASGAIDYITKPVQADILAAKISLFMELWRLKHGLEQEIINRAMLEDKNRYLADHDILTSLPNRRRLFLEIERAASRSNRQGKKFAILFIGLDGFKAVNDSLGHKIGDAVLIKIADQFLALVRKTDTVARFGGDEFVILFVDLEHTDQLLGRIEQTLQAARKTLYIDNEEIVLSASIGVVVYPDQIEDPAKLVDCADIAMCRSKQSGKNTFSFFSKEMDDHAHKRMKVERHLRHAIEKNEFDIHFQPLVNIENKQIVGVEALLRWSNPELGNVPPDYFIPIAESTGLIHEIGNWVFEQSISRIATLSNRSPLPLTVAINASTLQFKSKQWFKTIQKAVRTKKIKPENLEIEITERLLLDDSSEVSHQLDAIHKLGIKFSVDDFGTGYSALSYLKRCPINTVKIDKSFISGLPSEKEDMVLVRAIIAMAHGLELKVVAEGVETEAQWEFLKQEGCDFAQGFYFAKPLPIKELEVWIHNHSNQ